MCEISAENRWERDYNFILPNHSCGPWKQAPALSLDKTRVIGIRTFYEIMFYAQAILFVPYWFLFCRGSVGILTDRCLSHALSLLELSVSGRQKKGEAEASRT